MEQLINDFMANGEEYDDEALLALQKKLNPYSYMIGNDADSILAFSFTNMREGYLRRFLATSMIGFVFRMQREWEAPAALRRWTPKRKGATGTARDAEPHRPDEFLNAAERIAQQATSYAKCDADARAALADSARLQSEAAAAELLAEETKRAADVKAAALARKKASGAAGVATAAAGRAHRARLETALMFESAGEAASGRIFADVAAAEDNPDSADLARSVRLDRPAPSAREMPPAVAADLVKGFLASIFEFDPDAHVRSAYDSFVLAKRVPTAEAAEHIARIATEHAAAHNYTASPPVTVDPSDPWRPSLEELQAMRPADDPTRGAIESIPPQDTFHRWNFYTAVNYEKLREATAAIYHDRPDLEVAIAPYEMLRSDERSTALDKFDKFKVAHAREVISDIYAAQAGKWTLLGDFAANREKVDVLGPETAILKRIFERHEEDAKMGKSLMEHRIKRAKAKNIAMAGADDPALGDYIKHGSGKNSAASTGGRRVLTPEELAVLEKAKGDMAEARRLVEDKEYEALNYARAFREAAERVAREVPPTGADLLIVGGEKFCVVDSAPSEEKLAAILADSGEYAKVFDVVKKRCADINIRSAADIVVGLSDKRQRERRLDDTDARNLRDAHQKLATAREQAQIPDDAVQTYVYATGAGADGERTISQQTRFIEAAAPSELGAAIDEIEHEQFSSKSSRSSAK